MDASELEIADRVNTGMLWDSFHEIFDGYTDDLACMLKNIEVQMTYPSIAQTVTPRKRGLFSRIFNRKA